MTMRVAPSWMSTTVPMFRPMNVELLDGGGRHLGHYRAAGEAALMLLNAAEELLHSRDAANEELVECEDDDE